MNETLTLSDAGIALIKSVESCSLKAYWDVTGYAIGYGHHGPEVYEFLGWTQSQCDTAFINDTETVQNGVRELVQVPLTQGEFDALVSFSYNIGLGHFASSHVLVRVNAGEYSQVPNEFRRWVYVNHKVNSELAFRREKEIALWNAQ